MRIIAGPMAGVLRMPWRRFFLFNFLGAVAWVTTIACVGYLFGSQWERLVWIVDHVNAYVFAVVVVIAIVAWWRYRRSKAG